ncbi:unnamed protein product [Amoebophrya sp. A120]|nr:unnamed protein product [Amoebophrya sp. A120]|eukprot:GSA120T00010115001.1
MIGGGGLSTIISKSRGADSTGATLRRWRSFPLTMELIEIGGGGLFRFPTVSAGAAAGGCRKRNIIKATTPRSSFIYTTSITETWWRTILLQYVFLWSSTQTLSVQHFVCLFVLMREGGNAFTHLFSLAHLIEQAISFGGGSHFYRFLVRGEV